MGLKRKCDLCAKDAVHHEVSIIKGQKVEKHLCEDHAAEQGVVKSFTSHTPINELLTNFVKKHSGMTTQTEIVCDNCGMTFAKFREHGLLGCPQCYTAFDAVLSPLIERAHEGATHHIGKVPRRAGPGEQRQNDLLLMRKRLAEAVAAEDYELAARLRDDLRKFEGQPS
ncbi:MAG: UvrB/UvrC motif-containing protein [Phycisphaeraceae bacterium]|nr:UvrB/UvrC motif-containing protein [Phycisphaeraceae bacterium]